jgi:hypothetical protein
MTHRTTLTPDPQHLYWLRAHQRAVRRIRRQSAAYEHAWHRGAPAFVEWEQLRTANRREQFTYTMLCHIMDWR